MKQQYKDKFVIYYTRRIKKFIPDYLHPTNPVVTNNYLRDLTGFIVLRFHKNYGRNFNGVIETTPLLSEAKLFSEHELSEELNNPLIPYTIYAMRYEDAFQLPEKRLVDFSRFKDYTITLKYVAAVNKTYRTSNEIKDGLYIHFSYFTSTILTQDNEWSLNTDFVKKFTKDDILRIPVLPKGKLYSSNRPSTCFVLAESIKNYKVLSETDKNSRQLSNLNLYYKKSRSETNIS